MKNLEVLVNQIKPSTPEKVNRITSAKEEARLEEGLPYFCIVVENSHPRDIDTVTPPHAEEDELVALIEAIRDERPNIAGEVHFQIAVLTHEEDLRFHWTAYDVWITNRHVYIFSFDAAEDAASINQANYIMRVLRPEHCTFFLYSNPAHGVWTVQTSARGCRTFVVENISRLSQINIIKDTLYPMRNELGRMGPIFVEIHLGDELPEDMGNHIHRVTLPNIVDHHPDLFRLAQSWTRLNRYPPHALETVVSSKGRTLEQYARYHSELMRVNKEPKWVNAAMFHKDESQQRRIHGIDLNVKTRKLPVAHFHRILTARENPQALFGNRTPGGIIRHILRKCEGNLLEKINGLQQERKLIKLAIAQRNNSIRKQLYYWQLHRQNLSKERSDFIAAQYQRNENGQYVYSVENLREIKQNVRQHLQITRVQLQHLQVFLNELPHDNNQVMDFLNARREQLDADTLGEIDRFMQNFLPPPPVDQALAPANA